MWSRQKITKNCKKKSTLVVGNKRHGKSELNIISAASVGVADNQPTTNDNKLK